MIEESPGVRKSLLDALADGRPEQLESAGVQYQVFPLRRATRVRATSALVAVRRTEKALAISDERAWPELARAMVEALRSTFGDRLSWPAPRGGFFLWATLPDQVDADRLLPRAVEHGVIYVAGEAFFVNGSGRNLVRLSFSAPPPERIREGVRRFGAAVAAELEELTSAPAGGSAPPRRAIP